MDANMVAQANGVAATVLCLRLSLAVASVVAVAGCGPRRSDAPPSAPVAIDASPAPTIPQHATRYEIDAERSIVTLHVYRAGRLARLGHNHVITSGHETGIAWSNGEPAGSGFEVRVPVARLVVDDPGARAAAGPDFPGELPEAAREGTRRNMLRPEVLDGERHAEIVVSADSLAGTWEQPLALADVMLRGERRSVEVPITLVRGPDAIVATGRFRILQSAFGITPFNVGGGALQVADEVDVSFEIHAIRQ